MEFPHDFTDKIAICIDNYKKINKKLPKYAVLNDSCFLELCNPSNPMVIPNAQNPNQKYLLHEKGSRRIEILTQKDLPEKELSDLTEKTKDMSLALVLSKSKNIKNAIFYNLSFPYEKLLEKPA